MLCRSSKHRSAAPPKLDRLRLPILPCPCHRRLIPGIGSILRRVDGSGHARGNGEVPTEVFAGWSSRTGGLTRAAQPGCAAKRVVQHRPLLLAGQMAPTEHQPQSRQRAWIRQRAGLPDHDGAHGRGTRGRQRPQLHHMGLHVVQALHRPAAPACPPTPVSSARDRDSAHRCRWHSSAPEMTNGRPPLARRFSF